MAFLVIPGGARLQARATYQLQRIENTFTYTHESGWGQDELDELTDAFGTAWHGSMLPLLNTAYQFNEVYARGEREPVDFESVNIAHLGNGSQTDVPLSGNVAFAISRRSGMAGRSARGRVYLGGFGSDSLLSPNVMKAGAAESLVSALEDVRSAVALTSWTEVIASATTDHVANNPAVLHVVTQYSATDLNVDSMRRRLNGRGE